MTQTSHSQLISASEDASSHDSSLPDLKKPLAALLTLGGDERMDLQSASGLNRYGCAPKLRRAIPFGNCTASSLTTLGAEGAQRWLDRLAAAAERESKRGLDCEAEALFREARLTLRRELGLLDSAVEIAFCPSGTDAELLALALVRGGNAKAVTNIISGPEEVGSGTTLAAAACYFQATVPAGVQRKVKARIDDALAASVELKTINLRQADGLMFEPEELDTRAKEMVENALLKGRKVILHVLAHSKTGAHAPSLACVDSLRKKYGSRVAIIIDAAQGRMSRLGMKAAIDKGYMVILTGSKFYGGPSFSGALFVPPEFWPKNTRQTKLPSGLADFFSAPELPVSWKGLRASLSQKPNIGLLLRWGAALAEIKAYYQVCGESRLDVLRFWEREVPARLAAAKYLLLLPSERVIGDDHNRLLQSKQTIFSFYLLNRENRKRLPKNSLLKVFHWMNRNLSELMPEASLSEKKILATEIHVGQPVLLTNEGESERCVLRIALGGALITRVAEDETLGSCFAARKEWLGQQIDLTWKKLDLIVEHFEKLAQRDAI